MKWVSNNNSSQVLLALNDQFSCYSCCALLNLHYRRIKGDNIETYKTVTGKYHPDLDNRSTYVTRGNNMRLQKSHVKYMIYENLAFTMQGDASVVYAVCRVSVCLSQAGTVPKWLNAVIMQTTPYDSPGTLSFMTPKISRKFRWDHP